jgi:hypothetical protein
MKFPLITALTALALLGTMAANTARAEDDPKAKAEFTRKLFDGDVTKGKKSYACFVRKYDAGHLAKHPQQKVSEMKLLVTAEIDAEDERPQHMFRMGVKFRNKPGNFDTGGSCGHSDVSEAPNGQPQLGCGVDCDGGGISVELVANNNKSVIVRLERVALWDSSKPDDERTGMTAGADDAVFRLDRVPLDQCKSLVTDKEELATMFPAKVRVTRK